MCCVIKKEKIGEKWEGLEEEDVEEQQQEHAGRAGAEEGV